MEILDRVVSFSLISPLLPSDAWAEGENGGRRVRFYSNDAAACEAMNAHIVKEQGAYRRQRVLEGFSEEEIERMLPLPEIFITPSRRVAFTGWDAV